MALLNKMPAKPGTRSEKAEYYDSFAFIYYNDKWLLKDAELAEGLLLAAGLAQSEKK